ncbi:hypothetical protein BC351_21525 [Paenibacillus ferrarius]|uniref:Uncharacterized protein n=1 Tax=Paenibacillus ferrarius TaxID=1469647 RepID=A0A1V4HNJ2_9BACL|nr:hypothetical protein [Paenibacillus ferrarius]OPH58925.1 hypothetical protein BC351_21525 [Paenibacillus ferrarius]
MLVFAMILTLTFNSLTFASSPTNQQEKANIKQQKELYKAIKEIEKNNLKRKSDGTFEITGKPKVEQEILDNLKLSMNNVNKLVNEGYFSTDENFRVYSKKDIKKGNLESNKTDYVEYDTFFKDALKSDEEISLEVGEKTYSLSFNDNVAKADSYSPPIGFYQYWWGWQLSLSEYATAVLVNGLNAGAGTAAVAAALQAAGIITVGSALITGIVSAVLWFGSSAIGLADSIGGFKGVYFRGLYTPPVFYLWARS